jgi:meso-butanediol dehydrogenase/(S,S)-butanediol dehydrogenase/diacetyl reductase
MTASSRFSDQVVFVTGGTSGLGFEVTQIFHEQGAKVFVTDLQERDVLKRLGGGSATFQTCDVSDPDDCQRAIEACIAKFGRLDILFHGAAHPGQLAPVTTHDVATFQKVINTNLCSAFYLARIAIPQMQKQGKGVIVNVGSTSGFRADYGLCSYNAAKAGIMNLTRAMAVDHAAEGIRVNAICPGFMKTPMTSRFQEEPEVLQGLLTAIPAGRAADPVEIARVVAFLATDEASYITGQCEQTDYRADTSLLLD